MGENAQEMELTYKISLGVRSCYVSSSHVTLPVATGTLHDDVGETRIFL